MLLIALRSQANWLSRFPTIRFASDVSSAVGPRNYGIDESIAAFLTTEFTEGHRVIAIDSLCNPVSSVVKFSFFLRGFFYSDTLFDAVYCPLTLN